VIEFHYSFATHAKDKDAAGAGKESPGGRTRPKASIPATSG
jgi:hypothetical protein